MREKKTILCYGDSNTWGVIGDWEDTGLPSPRFEPAFRWPSVMGEILGEDFHVVNEGLGGRTTIYTPSIKPWRNGEPYLLPCMYTQRPINLVILMLGTNDLQLEVPPTVDTLGEGIDRLVQIIQKTSDCGPDFTPPKVLILSPAEIKRPAENGRMAVYEKFHDEQGQKLSKAFPEVYRKVAQRRGCYFMNAAQFVETCGADGVHFTPESHVRLGKAVAEYVKNCIFPKGEKLC